jgi:hypothetical protein
MKTKVLVSLFLFFMPLFVLGCGGGGSSVSQTPPPDAKEVNASQSKMYENMKKAQKNPSR